MMYALGKPALLMISAWVLRCDRSRMRSAISFAVGILVGVRHILAHVVGHMTCLPESSDARTCHSRLKFGVSLHVKTVSLPFAR